MTQSVDTEEAAGPPPSDGLSLVGETKAFLKAWQRILLASPAGGREGGNREPAAETLEAQTLEPRSAGGEATGAVDAGADGSARDPEPASGAGASSAAGPSWPAEEVAQLRQRARDLEARARAANVTGLAHHLQACEHCFWNGEVDRAKLIQSLRNVSEVAWQWRQDLRTRSDVFTLERQGQVSHDRLTIEPPTLLTPPSIEMFQSSPPPASDWSESALGAVSPEPPEPLAGEPSLEPSWAKPSVLRRWFGAGHPEEAAPAPPRPPRKSPLSFPTLSDAVYSSAEASSLAPSSADAGADSELPEASSGEAIPGRRPSGLRWWSASAGVAAVAGVALLLSIYGGPSPESATSAAAAPGSLVPGSLHQGRALPALPRELLDQLLADAHRHGGIESPELADLLDGEAAELRDSGGVCLPGAIGCELIYTAALAPAPPAGAGRAAGAPGGWLEGLELPGIGVKDDARVRQVFEFHTRNSVGREAFQELLFRCGAHRGLVEAALARYGMPPELLALPMATSACNADAESDEGARGLWQLTPAAARAYHLRVKAQVVDERVDPAKSTEAGVRLLEDLQRKLGSWELAIAAFQVGPLALIAQLREAGEGASYWALDESGAMPPEAAKHVPKVQAFALILANLGKFRFQPGPQRPTEATAELEVPPGTRLGLVARAVASSASRIRELNPDVLGDRVPDWPGERFVLRVPSEDGERARETLRALIAAADHADECVPLGFDWGRQRFTPAMASRCEQASQR